MKINKYTTVLIALAGMMMSSCSGEIDALAYRMTGEIKMTPQSLDGNNQFIADLVAYYNTMLDGNGLMTYDIKEGSDSAAYDSYVLSIRSTETTDEAAISALISADEKRQEWISKLPSGNWDTDFTINYANYNGSGSGSIEWEKTTNFLSGTWTGKIDDSNEVSFTVTDERVDEESGKWTTPCSMNYGGKTYSGAMKYTSSISMVNTVPTDSVTGSITFAGDDTGCSAVIMLVATKNATSCAVTNITLNDTSVIDVDSIEKGVALTRKE